MKDEHRRCPTSRWAENADPSLVAMLVVDTACSYRSALPSLEMKQYWEPDILGPLEKCQETNSASRSYLEDFAQGIAHQATTVDSVEHLMRQGRNADTAPDWEEGAFHNVCMADLAHSHILGQSRT
jgi:hypothetical protein